jgi:hypothetical protein
VVTASVIRAMAMVIEAVSRAIALMMEAVSTSESSVNLYETTRRNIQEGWHLDKLYNNSFSGLVPATLLNQ